MDKINVGDVVTITRGTRYPPKDDETVGIVIEEMPTVDGFEPIFVVMWDGQMDGLPERRLKKLDKNEHACTKLTQNQLNYIHNQSLTQEAICQNKIPRQTTLSSQKL